MIMEMYKILRVFYIWSSLFFLFLLLPLRGQGNPANILGLPLVFVWKNGWACLFLDFDSNNVGCNVGIAH